MTKEYKLGKGKKEITIEIKSDRNNPNILRAEAIRKGEKLFGIGGTFTFKAIELEINTAAKFYL